MIFMVHRTVFTAHSVDHQQFLHDKVFDDLLVACLEHFGVGLSQLLQRRESSEEVGVVVVEQRGQRLQKGQGVLTVQRENKRTYMHHQQERLCGWSLGVWPCSSSM